MKAEAPGGNFGRSFLPAVPTARAYYLHRSDISILLRAFERKSYIVVFYMRFARDFHHSPRKRLWPIQSETKGEEAFAVFANDMERQR
jgi:hypothetical protein